MAATKPNKVAAKGRAYSQSRKTTHHPHFLAWSQLLQMVVLGHWVNRHLKAPRLASVWSKSVGD